MVCRRFHRHKYSNKFIYNKFTYDFLNCNRQIISHIDIRNSLIFQFLIYSMKVDERRSIFTLLYELRDYGIS